MAEETPPYRRIADDVRRRIESGELGPGDRVPSARQLTRDFGVAIATATRALTTLRQEGVTESRPGVGTVVAVRPARTRHRVGADDLTRDRIVRTAIRVADTDGMAELSMRRVAAELDVPTMSIYRHVPGKDDLVVLMINEVLGEERLPTTATGGWRMRVERCSTLQWTLFRRHLWLGAAMSLTRPQMVPNALAHTEWMLAAFDGTALTMSERMYINITLFSFVRGIATALESEADARRETGLTEEEWMEAHTAQLEGLIAATMPVEESRLMRIGDFDFDLDRLFTFGLRRLLDGLSIFVEERGLHQDGRRGARR